MTEMTNPGDELPMGTFEATRKQLLDQTPVDGVLAAARGAIANGGAPFGLLRIRSTGLRRIDVWRSDDLICIHNVAPEPGASAAGSVGPAAQLELQMAAIIGRLMGPLDCSEGGSEERPTAVTDLMNPARIPADLDTVLIVWRDGPQFPRRLVIAVGAGGTFTAFSRSGEAHIDLRSAGALQVWAHVVELLAAHEEASASG